MWQFMSIEVSVWVEKDTLVKSGAVAMRGYAIGSFKNIAASVVKLC